MKFEPASTTCTFGVSGAIAAAMQHTAQTLHFILETGLGPPFDASFAASAADCS